MITRHRVSQTSAPRRWPSASAQAASRAQGGDLAPAPVPARAGRGADPCASMSGPTASRRLRTGASEIQRFPAMQLGGAPPQLIDQVIDGTVDIVWTLPGYTPNRFPRTEVFELPFMMANGNAEADQPRLLATGRRDHDGHRFRRCACPGPLGARAGRDPLGRTGRIGERSGRCQPARAHANDQTACSRNWARHPSACPSPPCPRR